MKIYIGFLLLFMVSLFSCTEKVVEPYSDSNYVYFANNSEDTTNFSFFFYNNAAEVSFPIEVKYAGDLLTKDTRFRVVIDAKGTTIDPRFVEIPEFFTLKPSTEVDEEGQLISQKVNIKLINNVHFDNYKDTLTIKIIDGGDCLSVGTREYGYAVIIVTSMAAKPIWWDEDITDVYLGEYSDKKYSHFMLATKVYDLTDMSSGIIRDYSLRFKRYLEKHEAEDNTIYEDEVDGEPLEKMVVKVNG